VTFGETIQRKREALGMSVWKLAKLAGIGVTQLQGIENGNQCTLKTAHRLFVELGLENIKTEQLQAKG